MKVFEKKSGRSGALLSGEELDRDDRQRLRRAAKNVRRKQRRLEDAEERLVAKVHPGAGNKYEAKKLLEEIRGDKRVVQGKPSISGKSSKSSDFFSELQQQAQIDIASKKAGLSGRKREQIPVESGAFKKVKL